jgi:hypothetical protein
MTLRWITRASRPGVYTLIGKERGMFVERPQASEFYGRLLDVFKTDHFDSSFLP